MGYVLVRFGVFCGIRICCGVVYQLVSAYEIYFCDLDPHFILYLTACHSIGKSRHSFCFSSPCRRLR